MEDPQHSKSNHSCRAAAVDIYMESRSDAKKLRLKKLLVRSLQCDLMSFIDFVAAWGDLLVWRMACMWRQLFRCFFVHVFGIPFFVFDIYLFLVRLIMNRMKRLSRLLWKGQI